MNCNCDNWGHILGSTLTIKVEWSYPADPSITLDDVDFVCKFQGRNSVMIPKSQMYHESSATADNWYAYVDTRQLGVGMFFLELTAYIPDAHAPEGVKTDIQRYNFKEPVHA